MIIARTDTDNIIFPQDRPRESGTYPIVACTVAFGKYAMTQNSFLWSA